MRSVVAALAFATGKRGFVSVYESVPAAAAQIAKRIGTDSTTLLEKLRKSGLLEGGEVKERHA